MTTRKLRFLFIQPEFHRHYVTFFPVYEPLHGLLFAGIAGDLAESIVFDRRFDSEANLERLVRDFRPDLVGLTTHTAGEVFNVQRLTALVKRVHPRAVTIVGGQHATLLPEDFFHPCTDLVCVGPGEDTFREVVETMASGSRDFSKVDGLAVREGTEFTLTHPRQLESKVIHWPKLDRSLLPKKYLRHYLQTFERRTTVYTITTSGCPHRCTFCSLWAAARGTYRRRPPEDIVQDIASQAQPYVHLTDDNTFCTESHAAEIARLLKRYGVKKKILAYARADTIVANPGIFAEWRKVGLGALVVGMEAVSDKHLATMNKKSSVDVNVAAHRIMEKLEIENWAHFVLMPEFSKADFDEVWDFCERLDITYPVFVPMTPVPGTPLFFESKEQHRIRTFDYGFYNLEYQVAETTLPKAEWYDHFLGLYDRSCSAATLWRRRRSPSFHARPALGRAVAMGQIVRTLRPHIREQLEHERLAAETDIDHLLPPGMRRDYRPVNYYNPKVVLETEAKAVRLVVDGKPSAPAHPPPAAADAAPPLAVPERFPARPTTP